MLKEHPLTSGGEVMLHLVTYFWFEFYKFAAPTVELDHILCLWRGAVGIGSWSGFDSGTRLSLRRAGMLEWPPRPTEGAGSES